MKSVMRKRQVSSCISCYTKKQKCSRELPCNHCTRRGRPHDCVYYSSQGASSIVSQAKPRAAEEDSSYGGHQGAYNKADCVTTAPLVGWSEYKAVPQSDQGGTAISSSLVERFGYFEDSHVNTLALVRMFTGEEGPNQDEHGGPLVDDNAADEVRHNLERMPTRQILDFLVQYFITEVNWIDNLVDVRWFLAQYQQWWSLQRVQHTADIDFAVLMLRICSYASQFLPSPSYTLDQIRGVSLADIRKSCDAVAEQLATIGYRYDSRGSMVRVQHLALLGLRLQCEGNMRVSWETLSHAIHVAQGLGIDRNSNVAISGSGASRTQEREMRYKTLCCLYVWDSMVSRNLDRAPFLPDDPGTHNWPKMNFMVDPVKDNQNQVEFCANEPDTFTERVLQAQLASFWRKWNAMAQRQRHDNEYDVVAAENRYECFCNNFLPNLPPAFTLLEEPNKTWDKSLPKLALQRQQLHIAIFDSICCNFRPLLLMRNTELQKLPVYKRVLLASQRRTLAASALCVLEGVKTMHAMLGCNHSRFVWLVFPTFEAGVLLACLLLSVDMHWIHEDPPPTTSPSKTSGNPIRARLLNLTREVCLAAANNALSLLHMLAEMSSMAEAGAQTLSRLLERVTEAEQQELAKSPENSVQNVTFKTVEVPVDWSSSLDILDPNLIAEVNKTATTQDFPWDSLITGFN